MIDFLAPWSLWLIAIGFLLIMISLNKKTTSETKAQEVERLHQENIDNFHKER